MIYYLLPAYNEERSIADVLRAVTTVAFPGEEWRIVVVDDGSRDHTPQILDEWKKLAPVTVLAHETNQGLGAAMRTGLTHLGRIVSEDDAVVALDADNTQDPALAVRMRAKQKAEDLDIVIASRYCRSSDADKGEEIGLAFHRKVLSRGASSIMAAAFRIKGATDYSCGFRLYSGRILKRAGEIYGDNLVEEKDFVCMVEILVKLSHIGAKVGEVPLVLRYDLKSGPSKLKITRTVLRYFRLIWAYKVLGRLRRYRYAPPAKP